MARLALREPLLNRVSWGALFAGFFFGFGVWMVLLALGAGIGLTAFDPRNVQHWQGLGIGFGIWGVIAGIIALFLGAWLAARLSASDSKLAGMLHGAALWGFMLVAGLWIATTAVTRTAGMAIETAGGAAQAAGAAAADQGARAEMERQAAAAQQQLQQIAGADAAETAATAGAAGTWAFFLFGLLTLAAAIFGGRVGVPHDRYLTMREERVPPHGQPLSPQRV
jgi:hypothetical protein